jgi:DNA-binding response OmpR family regulator
MRTILVVEDELKIARLVGDYLTHAGFEVIVTPDGGSAISSARGHRPDLVVLDLGLPGRDGWTWPGSFAGPPPSRS